MEVREIKISDYPALHSLWQRCHGIGLHSDMDSEHGIGLYLARNPGLSFVAIEKGKIVGAVLCGHDGRRGYLHHLVVAPEYRQSGVAAACVRAALEKLRAKGVRKCSAFVFEDNRDAIEFWQSIGWVQRDDLKVVSKNIIL
jgi:ribosomal protein S18 acetylase RimI-like enzyme